MRRALFIITIIIITGCATHPAPTPAPIAAASPTLYLNEGLPATARICVMRNPWNDATLICLSVGELRALLRSRQDVVAHGLDTPTP
jgi:hypothetical protein